MNIKQLKPSSNDSGESFPKSPMVRPKAAWWPVRLQPWITGTRDMDPKDPEGWLMQVYARWIYNCFPIAGSPDRRKAMQTLRKGKSWGWNSIAGEILPRWSCRWSGRPAIHARKLFELRRNAITRRVPGRVSGMPANRCQSPGNRKVHIMFWNGLTPWSN